MRVYKYNQNVAPCWFIVEHVSYNNKTGNLSYTKDVTGVPDIPDIIYHEAVDPNQNILPRICGRIMTTNKRKCLNYNDKCKVHDASRRIARQASQTKCSHILKSGQRKDQLCGKVNCYSHSPTRLAEKAAKAEKAAEKAEKAAPSNVCKYVMVKGVRKGMSCGSRAFLSTDFCCNHLPKKSEAPPRIRCTATSKSHKQCLRLSSVHTPPDTDRPYSFTAWITRNDDGQVKYCTQHLARRCSGHYTRGLHKGDPCNSNASADSMYCSRHRLQGVNRASKLPCIYYSVTEKEEYAHDYGYERKKCEEYCTAAPYLYCAEHSKKKYVKSISKIKEQEIYDPDLDDEFPSNKHLEYKKLAIVEAQLRKRITDDMFERGSKVASYEAVALFILRTLDEMCHLVDGEKIYSFFESVEILWSIFDTFDAEPVIPKSKYLGPPPRVRNVEAKNYPPMDYTVWHTFHIGL